jgi:leucine-rich repeat kinase 2
LGSENSGIEFWLNSITCHAPLSPILIIGTHVDQVKKYELPVDYLKSRYPQIVDFFYVSSYNGVGIEKLANAIIATALKEKYMVTLNTKIFKIVLNQFNDNIKREKKYQECFYSWRTV